MKPGRLHDLLCVLVFLVSLVLAAALALHPSGGLIHG
ncbi:MAG: hypothetical protein JWQ97_2919 [Phenylobacterium sp.]|nr:hypothetical protein [Phenylobacterium sp.]